MIRSSSATITFDKLTLCNVGNGILTPAFQLLTETSYLILNFDISKSYRGARIIHREDGRSIFSYVLESDKVTQP